MKRLCILNFIMGALLGLSLAPLHIPGSIVLTTPAVASGPVSVNNTGISTFNIEFEPASSQVIFTAPYGVPTTSAGKTTAFVPDLIGFKPITITIAGINLTGTQVNPVSWQS